MGAPAAPRSRKKGVKKSFGFACLLVDVIVPPEASIKGEAEVLCGSTVGDRVTGHGESPLGDNTSSGEEHDLCLGRIEGKTASRSPVHEAVTAHWTRETSRAGSAPPLRMAQSSANATPRVPSALIRRTASSKARDQKLAEQTPPCGKPIPVVRWVVRWPWWYVMLRWSR